MSAGALASRGEEAERPNLITSPPRSPGSDAVRRPQALTSTLTALLGPLLAFSLL
jgi:hypothetical protein